MTFEVRIGEDVIARTESADQRQAFTEAFHLALGHLNEGPIIIREAGLIEDRFPIFIEDLCNPEGTALRRPLP